MVSDCCFLQYYETISAYQITIMLSGVQASIEAWPSIKALVFSSLSFLWPVSDSLSVLNWSLDTQSIYKHIVDNYEVVYVAGGAAQNAARCAQYVLPEKSTAYLGCVGDDDLANQLRAANDKEGLHSAYQVEKGTPTGSCAVVITGHDR